MLKIKQIVIYSLDAIQLIVVSNLDVESGEIKGLVSDEVPEKLVTGSVLHDAKYRQESSGNNYTVKFKLARKLLRALQIKVKYIT